MSVLKKLPIYLHKIIYPILIQIFKILRKHKLVLVNNLPKIDGNAIFAVNHSNRYDIPYTCEVLGRQCYVLIGKQPLELIDRQAFILNGTVWVDRKSREDKKKSVAKIINLLRNGANLVIFPEGTWNLTPSKPMLPLYWGIIDIAKASGRPIIPIVLEYTDENCYVAFGDSMTITADADKGESIRELTDRFTTLKWTIWERFSDTGCNTAEEWEAEVQKRFAEYPKLDYEYEKSVVRKEYDTAEEVFGFVENLILSKGNAFLFRR